jgi:S-adenosylmethionine decarboxylase proenzyme
MNGLHLTADLQGCEAGQAEMTEVAALRGLCVQAVQAAGLAAVGELFHAFNPTPGAPVLGPCGITGVVLLAESHLAVHTWPERGMVTLDVYVCNLGEDNSAKARTLMDALLQAFSHRSCDLQALQRGRGLAPLAPKG